MRFFLLSLIFFAFGSNLLAQENDEKTPPDTKAEIEKEYQRNIKKPVINGVYIPVDVEDAMKELEKLSPAQSLEKFKNAPENTVAEKLHFGLGRWMIYNWNFYYGSRLEYYLKKLGISHPDDMADFLIISFHRYLNKKPLDSLNLAKIFHDKRMKIFKEQKEVIDTIKVRKK